MMYWVYGRESCSYCKRAVDLLKANGLSVAYIDINGMDNTANWATVPQIFSETIHIGGYEDLLKYVEGRSL